MTTIILFQCSSAFRRGTHIAASITKEVGSLNGAWIWILANVIGACTGICDMLSKANLLVQASQQIQASVCSNQRARAAAYPTQVAQGMLWVWPEAGPHAWLESAMTSPKLIPEMDDSALAGSDV